MLLTAHGGLSVAVEGTPGNYDMTDYIREKDWLPVTESMFLKDAEVICGVLEREGIQTKIVEPSVVVDSSTVPYSVFGTQVKTGKVCVPRPLLPKARAVLEAKEKEAETQG